MLTADADMNDVHIRGRWAHGDRPALPWQTHPAGRRDSRGRGLGRGRRHRALGGRRRTGHVPPLARVPAHAVHPPADPRTARRRRAPPAAPGEGRRPRVRREERRLRGRRSRHQPRHRRGGRTRRRHGRRPARHLPRRRRHPHRPQQRRPARRRQRPHQAPRHQEPHRTRRPLRLPLRWRQVLLVVGRRPHLAVPEGPLGLPHRGHQDKGVALRGMDRQQARRMDHPHHRRPRPPRRPVRHGPRRLEAAPRTARPAASGRRRRPHAAGAHGGRRRGRGVLCLGRRDQVDVRTSPTSGPCASRPSHATG